MMHTAAEIKLARRSASSHKGDNGRVLVVGGSIDYVGAVLLASLAAYRAGADWVQVAAPEKVAWAINTFSPDIVTTKVKGEYFATPAVKKIVDISKNFDVTLIGSGIGKRHTTRKFAAAVIRKIKGFKVIDADAITAVKLQNVSNAILTPHRAELDKLLANSKIRSSEIKNHINGNVILLKGKVDKIISKHKTAYNKTGNEGMTVAGTGDVLAGLTAGILSQEKNLFKSACAAAYVNGKAGDELLKQKGYGFIASELLEKIPVILRRLRNG
jgi:NAD(P)H-hydrate epimerase